MPRIAAMIACGVGVGSAAAMAVTPVSPPTPVPVLLRFDAIMDACPSTVRPRLPRGGPDGFVSLRAGPGIGWPEIARLHADALMLACERAGAWSAVIVQPRGGGDCAIPVPAPTRTVRYAGPCRHGWAAQRFLETVAG